MRIIAIRRGWFVATTICVVFGLGFVLFGGWSIFWPDMVDSFASERPARDSSSNFKDIYYISARGLNILSLGLFLLLAAATTFLISRLGNDRTKRSMYGAVVVLHIAVGVLVTYPFWVRPLMNPRRYVDFPGSMVWVDHVIWLSSALAILASGVIFGCLLVALISAYQRRKP